MKTSVKHSVKATTKAAAKPVQDEPHYSLMGVENGESVKGRALRMAQDEATTILDAIRSKYPALKVHAKHPVVVRLPDERKNAVILACSVLGTPVLKRTSDLFQQPTPFMCAEAKTDAKHRAQQDARKNRRAPVVGKVAAKPGSMLSKAMDEVKARAAKGAASARAKLAVSPKGSPKAAKASPPVAPAAAPAPAATVAPVSSPATQG